MDLRRAASGLYYDNCILFQATQAGGGGGQANMCVCVCVCVCWAQGRCLALTKSERRRQRQWNLAASNFGIHALSLSLSLSLSHLHTHLLTHTFILTHTCGRKPSRVSLPQCFPTPAPGTASAPPAALICSPKISIFQCFELKNKIILQNLRTFIRFYLLSTPEL